MAFFDWNRNGKIDAQDMFLEYNIFKACTEDESEDIFDSDDDFEEYDEFLDELDGGGVRGTSKVFGDEDDSIYTFLDQRSFGDSMCDGLERNSE